MSGRIRTIKPEWLEDEALVSCSIAARLLSAALMLLADDHGRGRAGAVTLGAAVFAFEPDPRGTAAAALVELERIRFVGTWCENGQTYFAIRNWTKHQRVDHPGKPRIPSPPETLWNPRESLAKVPETLAPDLRSPISDLDLRPPTTTKTVQAREACPAPADPEPGPDVARVWSAYLEGRAGRDVGGNPPKLTPARRDLIRRRLRDHPPEQLADACRGVWLLDFNFRGGHTTIELALRDAGKVERYAVVGAKGERVPDHQPGGRAAVQPSDERAWVPNFGDA